MQFSVAAVNCPAMNNGGSHSLGKLNNIFICGRTANSCKLYSPHLSRLLHTFSSLLFLTQGIFKYQLGKVSIGSLSSVRDIKVTAWLTLWLVDAGLVDKFPLIRNRDRLPLVCVELGLNRSFSGVVCLPCGFHHFAIQFVFIGAVFFYS